MNNEEKKLLESFKVLMLQVTQFDEKFIDPDVPVSDTICHSKWKDYLTNIANHPGMRILEIGSREVTGKSTWRQRLSQAEYIGFDYYPGDNVNIVGDAHRLSTYFDKQQIFDLIFTSACFEHFAMPWVVALEISKMLKTGGLVFIETHFSFSSHERPWHFFQFSDMGLKALFPKALGFECIEAAMSNPIVGRYSTFADNNLKHTPVKGLYCHSEYLGRKIKDVSDFDWTKAAMSDVVGDTVYPKDSGID